jgi:type II secretory pathway predicted ATPase ExeA/septal ring-binding cell division protein DamX
MYYAFFGLTQPPFKITPDTDVFFEGGNRGAILEALIYAITNGEGIIKVTGEVGSGKTMLCRVLQTRLPENIETVYLANPSVSPEEILHAIAFELQLPIAKDASRIEVMHALNTYLLERHSQQRQVVVFVEESQGMPIATLEEIRLLSNLETQQYKLLQILLFGQPELDENLRQPQIRQLRERITHSFTLSPLDEGDVRAYLAFRLHAAGYHGPDLFSRRVIAYMTQACEGLTRRINLVADKALLAAFAEGTHNVSLKHVKAAVRDSEFSDVHGTAGSSPLNYALGGLALGGLLGGGLYAAYLALTNPRETTSIATPAQSTTEALPLQQTGENTTAAVAATTPQPSRNATKPANSPTITRKETLSETKVRSAGLDSAPPPQTYSEQSGHAAANLTAAEKNAAIRPLSPESGPLPKIPGTSAEAVALAELADPGLATGDVLEQRLHATDQWLAQQRGSEFSIQLLGSNDPELLRAYFKTIGKYLEIEKVYVYRTIANRRPSLTVLYGNFVDRAEVNRMLDSLPDDLKANRPYYRTIHGIRSEIARHRSS